MKIHSSSLAFIPTGYSSADKKEHIQPVNNITKTGSENKQDVLIQNPAKELVQTSKTVDTDIVKLFEAIEKLTITPINSHAVNAYILENIQPLKQQQSELLPRIDIFV
ncbi:MAG: hypothetical protein KAT04_06305 [Methylococcales bacterium]|nr:hypothetical protein [Methylococcales bacterium]